MILRLIGLAGLARTGKDTVGQYLHHEYNFELYAFADPIKKAAVEMFGIPLCDFYDEETKEVVNDFWGFSPRQIAQLLGTEGGRQLFREDIWVKRGEVEWINYQKKIAEKLKKHPDYLRMLHDMGAHEPSGLVFTDVRFENEAHMIRSNGGTIIHIKRDNSVQVNEHISEQGIKVAPEDDVVYNNSTFEELYKQIDRIHEYV